MIFIKGEGFMYIIVLFTNKEIVMMRSIFVVLVFTIFMPACMEIGELTDNADGQMMEAELESIESALTDSQLKQRCDTIKVRAANKGLTNALIIAGIANHETGMAQCFNEYSKGFACSNVGTSTDCPTGTGGVLGGGGDCQNDCTKKCGGIGMFQLDAGTYTNTLDTYGSGILNVNGNIDAGVDFVIKKLGFQCEFTPDFGTYPAGIPAALAWFNSAVPGTPAYDTFMTALAACYNGCLPGWNACGNGSQTHENIKSFYKAATDGLYTKFGSSYWYPNASCSGAGPFSGQGSNGGSGTTCLKSYTFNTVAGNEYKVSTCGSFTGDPYLKVTGTCSCSNDDACGGYGSECTCTAASNGTATVCASSYSGLSAGWNYSVTCSGKSGCTGAGPFSGNGSNGGSGTACLSSHTFNTVAGKKYKVSTCGSYSGDPYLKVTGTCSCSNDDACGGYGSECTCTAASNGTATVCASSYKTSTASWNYIVTCL